jgi:Leucine-rich repeat (LRR) protein
LPAIETLSLQQNHFSDEGLARLTGKERLKGLYIGIGDLRVTDAGLAHLGDFKKLEGVDVQNSQVTARGLEQLVKDLPNLKELWLSDKMVTEAKREALRQARPGLKIL